MPQTRVYIVDNNELSARFMGEFISSRPGMEIVGHGLSGEEAIEEVTGEECDVVLMDLMMPGINGLEATRRLRAGGFTGGIIMVSIQNEQEYVQSAIAAGAEAFVAKDKFCDEIENVIRRVIDSKR